MKNALSQVTNIRITFSKDLAIKVEFNKPALFGNEIKYISQALENLKISGDGFFTKKASSLICSMLDVKKCLLTTSCTDALEMCAILLNIKPGDEIIVPSYTFVSTVNAFILRGAVPVFCDIREDTLNIDEKLIPSLITDRTKAIICVHYAGVACEMESLIKICEEHKLPLIEDNAHGFLGKYNGNYLGSFGVFSTLSFHETKNFTCGEGGALIINSEDYFDRAEIIREKGTNRSQFFRGEVDKYSWVDLGSSFLPSDMISAFLCGQLEQKDLIQKKRKEIWHFYKNELGDWAQENGIELPYVPDNCEQAYHMFYLKFPNLSARTHFIEYLKRCGINSVFHYLPLNKSSYARQMRWDQGHCPVSESISDRIVRLPFHNSLSDQEVSYVVAKIKSMNLL